MEVLCNVIPELSHCDRNYDAQIPAPVPALGIDRKHDEEHLLFNGGGFSGLDQHEIRKTEQYS